MLQWFRSLFADALKTGLLAALAAILPPVAVIWTNGLGFLTTSHRVAGWAIVVAAGLAGVLVVSVVWNLVQRWHAASPRRVQLVADGGIGALSWHIGAVGSSPAMQIVGDFHITNVAATNITIPQSVLVVSHRAWGVVPRRTRIVGDGLFTPLAARSFTRERLMWWLVPPVLSKGRVLHARVGLVDNFGRTNWGDWLDFRYM